MSNYFLKFNDFSIQKRMLIIFAIPQLLLLAVLSNTIIEHGSLEIESYFIISTILLLFGLHVFIRRNMVNPLLDAVDSGLNSITSLLVNFNAQSSDEHDIQVADSESEISQIIIRFLQVSIEMEYLIEREKEINRDLEGKADFILDVVSNAAKGDLSNEMMVFTGNDSIAQVARGVKTMLENLNSLVKQVQVSGIQVTSSATQIAATAKEQEATVTEQAASTNQIMSTITEISATGKELLRTMDKVKVVAENTTASATSGQHALISMESTMGHMQAATDSISAKLAVLSEKADNINTVVTTINRVADQTNLLSLNAAIEAEKAGEYGRGFSVVATEIRRLADQTAVATWDIEQMVKEMQSAVSAGVMSMDKFSDEVSNGVNDVAKVGAKLSHIIDEVQALLPQFETVNDGMRLQSEGAEQIKESMAQLNEMAQQTSESLVQSGQSIEQLKQAARGLQDGISIFKVTN